jgi:sugar transferase (PEP-CTERM/EpsH1 system associated)
VKPDLLFLAHRIPYPPDKGEKIRSYHMLRHLAETHRIHLGCLTTEPDEAEHSDVLRQWCASVGSFPMDRRRQKLGALARLRPGRPLMLDYYRVPALQRWVDANRAALPGAAAFVSTVAMMPYLKRHRPPALILDAMDIDSEKWTAYAATAAQPMRAIWAREGRTLLAYERQAAAIADATLFVSPAETSRFAALAPEAASRLHAVENGVDLERFSPTSAYDTPFAGLGPHIVFTGHMDYWPNADAVAWFAADVMPTLRAADPAVTFHIVGANPGLATFALAAQPGVHVTGWVADVRPYIAHASVCVAPLRIARGIQNKVLEAMAMGRPVVASPQAFEGVRAAPGREILVADGGQAMASAILTILDGAKPGLGQAARTAMESGYAWPATLAPLDNILAAAGRKL